MEDNKTTISRNDMEWIKVAMNAVNNTVIHSTSDIKKDIKELNKKLDVVEQHLNKLHGGLVHKVEQDSVKKSWRDYTPAEIFHYRWKVKSLAKTAAHFGCSKSTIQRICKEYKLIGGH